MKRAAGVALALALAPLPALGQCVIANTGSCAQAIPISVTINHASEISLSTTATALTSPAAADYTAGYHVDAGPTVTVKANAAWRLNISAGTGTWSATGPLANPAKPTSDLGAGTASAGPFTGLSVAGFQLASGAAATAGTAVTVYYRTAWHWTTDPPGSYSLTLTYTITSP